MAAAMARERVWLMVCVFVRACVAVCGDTAGALDGSLAVDHDGCGRWRDVCGVVGGRVVQMVREMTAHAGCLCAGYFVVWCRVVHVLHVPWFVSLAYPFVQ